jgi:hypothetical protein
MKKFITLSFLLIGLIICLSSQSSAEDKKLQNPLELTSKPYTRYWWFASMIKEEDVKYNLDWLKANGFGGVELAWVYPLNRFNKNDTSYTPRQEWLSPEWQKIVEFTIKYADSIGIGCDLTFGTLWPFGDTYVPFEQATQKYGDTKWRQEISRSWQHPKVGYVIDHLTSKNYLPYFNRLSKAFPRPETKIPQSYFIDSWEVETEHLWAEGFADDFMNKNHYDITPFMDSIYSSKNCRQLYDYMSLISDKVLEFYGRYAESMHKIGVNARGQVAGAPCDLISGYSFMDIPEGESMLFEPEYCSIPASAALLTGKKVVSSETFTCLYGWPRDFIRQEQIADLKLVADALFANGVNHIIWHGKAHNPKNSDSVNFYASTHIGSAGAIAEELPQFNKYLEKVSSYMKKGHTYSDVGLYLPIEDSWISGVMPKEKQFIWAWGYYEMRYVYFSDELKGYNPIWINHDFLEKGKVENGIFTVGDASFSILFVDAKYLDYKVIKRLIQLADEGLNIVMKKLPKNPSAVFYKDYDKEVLKLFQSKSLMGFMRPEINPLISGNEIPRHWCRIDNDVLYIYFPNPKSDRLKFPLSYGQSLNSDTKFIDIKINYEKKTYKVTLKFEPYQSLLYKIEKEKIEQIDIKYVPNKPIVKERPAGYDAPWLVK